MKILFTCELLSAGGAERVCVDVANGLNANGHSVAIATNLNLPITYKPDGGIRLFPVEPDDGKLRTLQLKRMKQILIEFCPDVVVTIGYFQATVTKFASLLTINCPVVSSDHNSFERPQEQPMGVFEKHQKYFTNYYFDWLTVLTSADKQFLGNRFKRMTVMPNPLSFKPLPEVPKKEKIILAVGRLNAWFYKGYDVLIKAWKQLANNHGDWTLKIVGAGSDESLAYLKEIADGCNTIQFEPYTENIIDEYRKAAIFVLSSRCEGFGLVLIEAMSQGCACVACDYHGRQAEIIDDSGLICEPGNVEQLRDKIEEFLNNEEKLKKYQELSLSALSKFDKSVIVQQWDDMLALVCNDYTACITHNLRQLALISVMSMRYSVIYILYKLKFLK